MTFAPGKRQPHALTGGWDRDLNKDLRRLRDVYRTDVLVSMLEDHELTAVGIAELAVATARAGIELIRVPVPDQFVPSSIAAAEGVVRQIVGDLQRGRVVVIHCMGGLGRTGLLAACVLVALGASPSQAIAGVRSARDGAVENAAQERFVASFAATFQRRGREDADT